MKNIIVLFLLIIISSCTVDLDSSSSSHSASNTSQPAAPENNFAATRSFYATGKNGAIQLDWAKIPDGYSVSIIDGTSETNETYYVEQTLQEIKLSPAATSYTFTNLKNSTVENRILKINKKGNTPVYTYILILRDSSGKEAARQTAQATPCQTDFEYSYNNNVLSKTTNVWCILLDPESFIPRMANVDGYTRMNGYGSTISTSVPTIKKSNGYSQYPYIFNNPDAITKLLEDAGNLSKLTTDFSQFLLSDEEIQWFTFVPAGAHGELYGKVVKKALQNKTFTDVDDTYEVKLATDIPNMDKAFRLGTKIRTKGYFKEGDGGAALYEIGNRSKYTYGSIKTKLGQSCNIIAENNFLNLVSLGAGNCTQITKANYKKWEEYESAKYLEKGKNLAAYRASHTGWEIFDNNDDAARWTEAKNILIKSRTSPNQTVTLYAPAGNYRCASGISMDADNFIFKGETQRRDINPDQQTSFEASYTPDNPGGSSLSGSKGTYFYTDNGSHFWWYHGFSSGIFGASNVRMEGITIEARETDSKRTFWHNKEDTAPNFTGITYHADSTKTSEPTQADQLWYSRQFMVSQSSNVVVKNCEFIITRHVRDEDVYTESNSEWLDPSKKTFESRRANQWVEPADLHTDKQFTTVTLFADWHNVTVDDCLIYNNSGVIRGSAFGFLDFYCNGSSNGTLSNSTLFCNIHDEMIGIFTKDWTFYPGERFNRSIRNVHVTGNKIYPTRDEHVDKIKPRVMVFTVGYDMSPNIFDVYIQNNYIWTDNLNSKLFSFGGFDEAGRGETIVSGNTIVIEDAGGSYLFETRPNITISNNNITLKSKYGKITQNGMFMFHGTNTRDLYVTNNNIDIQCNYQSYGLIIPAGSIGCVATGNNIRVQGKMENIDSLNPNAVFKNVKEVRNNTIQLEDDFNSVVSYISTKIDQDIPITNNKLIYTKDDHNDDYTWGNPKPEGSKYGSGMTSPSFLSLKNETSSNKLLITGNTVEAPASTIQNKNFIRNYNSNVAMLIANNKVSKFKYLRGLSLSNASKYALLNNTTVYGKRLNLEEAIFSQINEDSEPGKYEYIPDGAYYKLVNCNGKQIFPAYYDDGEHGTHPVTVIGNSSCTGDPSGHDGGIKKIPETIRTIEDYAFKESYAKGIKLPAGLESIGKEAFYNSKAGTNEWVTIHGKFIKAYYIDIPASVKNIGSKAFAHTDDFSLLIRCEAAEKPEGWSNDWISGENIDVIWGYKK